MKNKFPVFSIIVGFAYIALGILYSNIICVIFGLGFAVAFLIKFAYVKNKAKAKNKNDNDNSEKEKTTDSSVVKKEPVEEYTQPEELSESTDLRGCLRASEPKYKTVEEAISILEAEGFVLSRISTGGESSSHMWTMGFDCKYKTLEEFYEKAHREFNDMWTKASKCGGPCVEWENTCFVLLNNTREIMMYIFMPEDRGDTGLQEARYFFTGLNGPFAYDVDYAADIKRKLDILAPSKASDTEK